MSRTDFLALLSKTLPNKAGIYTCFAVVLRHDISYFTIYAHLSHIEVQKGSYVRQGNIIGRIEIDPRLFFSVFRSFDALNPERLIRDSREIIQRNFAGKLKKL